MTSRTTPVGFFVIALIGLITVGCSASTVSVFQALLQPPGDAQASPAVAVAPQTSLVGGDLAVLWPHPDGYSMILPAGWSAVAIAPDSTSALVAAVSAVVPVGLGQRIAAVMVDPETQVSAIAADPSGAGTVAPIILVLSRPTDGQRVGIIKKQVGLELNALPGVMGPVTSHDVSLPNVKGFRFDYSIDDDDLGELKVYSYLFRFTQRSYLVNCIASADIADSAEPIFDAIVGSLRFGI
jgi:hypothetical protein